MAPALPSGSAGSDRGAGQRFEAHHDAGNLRLVAAAIAAFGSVWLLAVTTSRLQQAVAIAGLIFAALWIRAAWRARRRAAADGVRDYLELGDHHLALVDDGQTRSIALGAVQSVEIDGDRLDLVLQLQGGELVRIEPRYRGIGLYELGERIRCAVARTREGAHDGSMVTIPTDG